MRVVAITGPMGAGKSTLTRAAREMRLPVFSADADVRHIYRLPQVRAQVTALLGGCNRGVIWKSLDGDPRILEVLEKILQPCVKRRLMDFLARQKRYGRRLAVMEIPLLFESRLDSFADLVVCADVDESTRRQRVLARPGMTPARLGLLERRQWPAMEKRAASDVLVPTGCGMDESLRRMKKVLARELR